MRYLYCTIKSSVVDAFFIIAYLYEHGKGTSNAIYWYKKAIENERLDNQENFNVFF